MTFDNRPDTITEIFDGCLTRGQVYRCCTAAVGQENTRFNPQLSNKDNLMGYGTERQREVEPSYQMQPQILRFGLNCEIKDFFVCFYVFKVLSDYVSFYR